MGSVKGAVKIRVSRVKARNERTIPTPGGGERCLCCGRPVTTANTWMLRCGPGSCEYAIPSATPDQGGGEMGCFPIGDDCLRDRPELHALAFKYGLPAALEDK